MNGEQTDLARRAARHAALADPARLQIIDLLETGDLSPLEMLARINIASNLLSHHLKVLERAGIIVRSRSEGDRRRTYVSLSPDAAGPISGSTVLTAPRVVFVCTANSARSQLAEHLWRTRSDVPAASAGTTPSPAVAPGAIAVAARHGLDLHDATPKLLADIRHDDDLLISVCDNAHEALDRTDLHWSVPDPVPSNTADAFEKTYRHLARRIDGLLPHLAA
ncbi:helix-turn-helix domain-containing protein [uncultured Microbacterium sp.]|uniref:arsenate reductase/protein-tyrosine-phosphatase family protein n=1 Tax=uncultured Microbacterium sp. TaxID=191216 RepID=UPI0025FAC9F7|nr:helix-turn-helix domain-containing protein [uncultured Microbacterium sp.]